MDFLSDKTEVLSCLGIVRATYLNPECKESKFRGSFSSKSGCVCKFKLALIYF